MRDGTNYNERTKEFNVIINLFVNKYRTALLLEIRDEGTDYPNVPAPNTSTSITIAATWISASTNC